MVSSLNLAYIHLRMEEIFGGCDWFGSMNVVFVGDLLQLPPVKGSHVFEAINSKMIQSKLGCMTSINIRRDTIVYDELMINERQKNDKTYSELLNKIRFGLKTDDVVEALTAKVINCSVPKQCEKLARVDKFPVCFLPTRLSCKRVNNEMLGKLGADIVKLESINSIDET